MVQICYGLTILCKRNSANVFPQEIKLLLCKTIILSVYQHRNWVELGKREKEREREREKEREKVEKIEPREINNKYALTINL